MNKGFISLQNSIDNKFLDDAEDYNKNGKISVKFIALAACICLMVGGIILHEFSRPLTYSDINKMGYSLLIPNGSDKVRYSVNKLSKTASAEFTFNENRFKLKTMEYSEPENEDYTWKTDDVNMEYSESDNTVSWSVGDGNMWCLSSDAEQDEIIWTAEKIINLMGYNLAVAPEGAVNISYRPIIENNFAIGETKFEYEGKSYAFRMASTGDVSPDFADISDFSVSGQFTEKQIRWCPAKIYTSENGSKVIWFDVVPGLLYSLTSEDISTENEIYNVANNIFIPAQDEN